MSKAGPIGLAAICAALAKCYAVRSNQPSPEPVASNKCLWPYQLLTFLGGAGLALCCEPRRVSKESKKMAIATVNGVRLFYEAIRSDHLRLRGGGLAQGRAVMRQYFPSRYFNYALILAALTIVLQILIHLVRMVASPKTDWLLKQYREAYEAFLCPMCSYPFVEEVRRRETDPT